MDKKSKIAIVIMRYPSRTEVFATRDFSALNKKYKVDVISYLSGDTTGGLPFWSPGAISSIIDSVRSINKFFFILKLMFAQKTNFKHFLKTIILTPLSISIFNRIVKSNVDLVHLFWGHYPSITALLLKEYSTIKVTSFLGAYDLEEKFWGTYELSNSDIPYVTHCNYNIELLNSYYDIEKYRILVMYRSLNVDDFFNKQKNTNPKLRINITYTGKCCRSKGVYNIINVLLRLHSLNVNFLMNFVGDGPDCIKVANIAKIHNINSNIIFHGWLDPNGVCDILKNTDIFLMLSEKASERLPNAVKEAMLSGCYVISSRSKGIEELVPRGGGAIYSSNHHEAISDHIIYCSSNIEYMRARAKVGQKHVLNNFNASINTLKLIKFFDNSIDGTN